MAHRRSIMGGLEGDHEVSPANGRQYAPVHTNPRLRKCPRLLPPPYSSSSPLPHLPSLSPRRIPFSL